MNDATISPADFGKQLGGFGINLLVPHLAAEIKFMTDCLGFAASRVDEGFAILRRPGMVMMLHHDRTYHGHPLINMLPETGHAGQGANYISMMSTPIRPKPRPRPPAGHASKRRQINPMGYERLSFYHLRVIYGFLVDLSHNRTASCIF